MNKELARYIVNYFNGLLTDNEKLGLKHLRYEYSIRHSSDANTNDLDRLVQLYKRVGFLSEEKEILELIKGGQDEFNQQVASRIISEYPDKVFINNCPNCGQLAWTPFAKQCRHCGHNWR